MAADELYKHIIGYFCTRRGTQRIRWLDLDLDMLSIMATMAPDERRRLAQLLRRLYRYTSNENYYNVTNGEFWLLHRVAPAVRCAFDVGANVGRWTSELLVHAPNASIHVFEPVPDIFAKLSNRLGTHAEVQLNNFGLLDQNTVAILNVTPGDGDKSSIFTSGEPTHEVACNFITGDSYVERARISMIDFLKIDCEGAEPRILSGFARTLERGAITIVQLEYGPFNIRNRWLLSDLYAEFRSLGYSVGRLYPSYVDFKDYNSDDETFFGGNIIACLESRMDLIRLIST